MPSRPTLVSFWRDQTDISRNCTASDILNCYIFLEECLNISTSNVEGYDERYNVLRDTGKFHTFDLTIIHVCLVCKFMHRIADKVHEHLATIL